MARSPVAFMSYAHIDNCYGQLTEFRERLSNEVHIQTGSPFPIFQDRDDIDVGQPWRERIETALSEVSFLIPILTPSFFKSDACREELSMFLKHERATGRNDLVLPVYYVSCRALEDEASRRKDPLLAAMASRQWADWRGLRFEPFNTPQVAKALMQLATQVSLAIDRYVIASTDAELPVLELPFPEANVGIPPPERAARSLTLIGASFSLSLHDELAPHLGMLYKAGYLSSWIVDYNLVDRLSDDLAYGRNIVLLVVTPEFLATAVAHGEGMRELVQRHENRTAIVVPILATPCDWGGTPFAKLRALPSDAKPISTWANRQAAFDDIARGLIEILTGSEDAGAA